MVDSIHPSLLKIGLDTENVCFCIKRRTYFKKKQALSISNITDIPKAQPDRWTQRQQDRVWQWQSLAELVVDTDLSVAQWERREPVSVILLHRHMHTGIPVTSYRNTQVVIALNKRNQNVTVIYNNSLRINTVYKYREKSTDRTEHRNFYIHALLLPVIIFHSIY